jgi:glucosamine--fructose-6-phosphate aminotransferase (isomerizing)
VHANGALCIAISQSGRSPDLLKTVAAYRAGGAFVVAFVNDAGSPLAALADETLPLQAGAERSVAATKSFIASLAGLAGLAAAWTQDAMLARDLDALPAALRRAATLDWSAALPGLTRAHNLFVIGRGYSLAIAQEAALKLKETCGLHAEAVSAAEVRHGPMAIVGAGFPVIAFATADAAGDDVRAIAAEFRQRGAELWGAGTVGGLPTIDAHAALGSIAMIQSFYPFADALSRARGFDPDSPPHLQKVTRTL